VKKRRIVITIDGPSGAGKGTVAREVAARLGLAYLDTGAMYRMAALLVARAGVDAGDEERVVELLSGAEMEFKWDAAGGVMVPLLEGEDVSDRLRTPALASLASRIATLPQVREAMVSLQRRAAGRAGGIVVEGRDMGTFVFPDADFKFYLDADPAERARRRWLEFRRRGIELPLEKVRLELEERDRRDMGREKAPLHPAPDAVIIDTTHLTVDEVVDRVLKVVEEGR